jgi:hypothetical protein
MNKAFAFNSDAIKFSFVLREHMQRPSKLRSSILYKLTIFCCCCFANKTKTTTWKKPKPKHWFVYKFYGFCCYKINKKQKSSVFIRMLGP